MMDNNTHSKVAPEVLEARWRDLLDQLADNHEDADFLTRLGNLAVEMTP